MNDTISISVLAGILTSMIRLATPYLYAAIGEAFAKPRGWSTWGWMGLC